MRKDVAEEYALLSRGSAGRTIEHREMRGEFVERREIVREALRKEAIFWGIKFVGGRNNFETNEDLYLLKEDKNLMHVCVLGRTIL